MDIRNYLSKAKLIRIKIEDIQNDIIELRSRLGVHSPATDSIPSDSHNTSSDKLILNVMHLEEEKNNEIIRLVNERQKIIDLISTLEDPDEYRCLYLKYIQEMHVYDIAKQLDVDERTVFRKISNALKHLSTDIKS